MRVRFGNFILDTDRRELLRGSQSVRVPPQALEALAILVERRPSAVAQTDLYDRLWPDTFVNKSNLHNVIHQLRAALGDGDHLIIRTVYGYGFSYAATAVETAPGNAGWQVVIGEREFYPPAFPITRLIRTARPRRVGMTGLLDTNVALYLLAAG